MKKLMLIILIGLFFTGCYEAYDNVIYSVTGGSSSVDITYRNKKGDYIILENVSLPWSVEWNETIDEDNTMVEADILVVNNDNNLIVVEVIDNNCIVLHARAWVIDEVVHLKRSW